tara:strand:- start:1415 stop:1570 length:156 start_codon:yes stop_codon:yes gene_type:complete
MNELNDNATVVERIMYYVNYDDKEKARALATVADFLEECYVWDVAWNDHYI